MHDFKDGLEILQILQLRRLLKLQLGKFSIKLINAFKY
jgi:hypothetical protein